MSVFEGLWVMERVASTIGRCDAQERDDVVDRDTLPGRSNWR